MPARIPNPRLKRSPVVSFRLRPMRTIAMVGTAIAQEERAVAPNPAPPAPGVGGEAQSEAPS